MLDPPIWGLVSTKVDYWLRLASLVLLVSLVFHTHSNSTIKNRKCFNHRSRKAAPGRIGLSAPRPGQRLDACPAMQS